MAELCISFPKHATAALYPENIYLFQVNKKSNIKGYEISPKPKIQTKKDAIDVVLMFLLLTLNIFDTFF